MADGKIRDGDRRVLRQDLQTAIKAIRIDQPCHGETDLFEFRGHKNRNLHLRFKRPDLVARLNAIAGGAVLKPVGAESVRERRARERRERAAARAPARAREAATGGPLLDDTGPPLREAVALLAGEMAAKYGP
jgi:hypothetical protein